MRPSDEQIMMALCCGGQCKRDQNCIGYCHRFDFEHEAKRIQALLETLERRKVIALVEDN